MSIKNKKILIGPSSFAEADKTPLNKLLNSGFPIVDNPFKRKITKEELLSLLDIDVIGVIAGLEPFDKEVLQSSSLKVISRVGSGLSNIDLNYAKELNIKVCSTPFGPTTAVAELTVGAMISLIRMLPQVNNDLHNGKWNKKIGFQLEDKIIAIIGFGRIGIKVAEILKAFKANIVIVDPFVSEKIINYKTLEMKEALSIADIITIHCSGDMCILGEAELNLMKDGVYILNTARGGLISEKSLVKNLDIGKIAGAFLDTFENEPYVGPLVNYENVILSPHIGSYTFECRKQMETEAVENLLSALGQNLI